ncbi:type I-F CRISPR-associated helicase Cas3f [Solidesulfovibrio magneticus]|uniref:HD Cas3-type domain-containing protein n=1 Tax=Solidesulfovibrio magneticus (strain ATCC 700980 / DSM 13731 / RS-1) TaxID=573370 RepID=C4XPX5_SOLM1|nr:type I-F CRISPR-associated helicase Cas3f [Solidesulfovibrio magneticus]BAH77675.1 hypothetical protein DMR_41840 [Solidesulfovibrio magneticus RS-1]
MNILLVSQCSGRAVAETRRIIDQFAERRGEGTWQTSITKDGLETLYRLLRKTARKNTSVACHWLKKDSRTKLLWIVGNPDRFNPVGAVPTNTTERDLLRTDDENTWHSLSIVDTLVGLAALFHDFGKANVDFQNRLSAPRKERNLFRHEWVSLCLLSAFVGNESDEQWLKRLATLPSVDDPLGAALDSSIKCPEFLPFEDLPPFAKAVGWLIVSHHRLPVKLEDGDKTKAVGKRLLNNIPDWIDCGWNEILPDPLPSSDKTGPYWAFPKGLPHQWESWRKRAADIAERALSLPKGELDACLMDPYIMHLSRMCLMLADHGFSRRYSVVKKKIRSSLYANTKAGQLDQLLEEHLLGVERLGHRAVKMLPRVADELPRLALHKLFRKRTTIQKYQWQDKAGDIATSIRLRSAEQGAFIVNMASTGCGKTLGNGRIMHNISDESRGMRCAFALGLRTLTLQTGREFRKLLDLGEDEVAIRVGAAASRELFDHYQQEAEINGSESSSPIMPENSYVRYGGDLDALSGMSHLLEDSRVRALLLAPLLVCTIDHLVPATESLRGGHQIAPMLRLLSGDLVLDELDDYGIEDLHAVTRLVYWAGLLGSRILISSATLPPALVLGMFIAYKQGRLIFQRNRGAAPGRNLPVCCMWVDEFHCSAKDCVVDTEFQECHEKFVEKRLEKLKKALVLRHGSIVQLQCNGHDIFQQFTVTILKHAIFIHNDNNNTDIYSRKRISFGLVRMANIKSLYEVALKLFAIGAPEGVRIHLCVYHSQFPLLLRSVIEQRLDRILDRKDPQAVFDQPDIRRCIDGNPEQDQLFIVLASPVAEVGRDHDYDWAIVEPSSMRSIIQLAGRIRRHRDTPWEHPNVALLHTNVRALKQPGKAAFCRPGFEVDTPEMKLKSHNLADLLVREEYEIIDAQPRIVMRVKLSQCHSLVDLEHYRLCRLMLKQDEKSIGAYSCWDVSKGMLSGILQRAFPFRRTTRKEVDVWLKPDDEANNYTLQWILPQSDGRNLDVATETRNRRVPDDSCHGVRISPWGETDYMQALRELAEDLEMELESCARRFGVVTLPESVNGWRFHPLLGFTIYSE